MDKMKCQAGIPGRRSPLAVAARLIGVALVVCLLALTARSVRAQAPLEPTQIVVGAPAQAELGSPVTVQAVLADSQGHPISGALISFTSQATFLAQTKDVVLDQAVTNAKGQAVARLRNNVPGNISLRAEFGGDEQYAASTATTQLTIIGDGQVYSDNFGGQTAGANAAPTGNSTASVRSLPPWIQSLQTEAAGWPVATPLLLVWSLYIVAVGFIFRIAALAKEPEPGSPPAPPDPGRPS